MAALIARAPANVFMHPAALKAAHATGFADIHMLLAWARDGAQPERLVGFWALQRTHIAPLWPSFLAAPPYDYAFLSNPVDRSGLQDERSPAFFDAIERERSLPNVIRLRYLDGSAETYPAIMTALAARGGQALKLSERERPLRDQGFGLKRSGSTRKKLRQDWNRLSALGAVDIVNDRARDAVRDASRPISRWKPRAGRARTAPRCLRRGGCDVCAPPDLAISPRGEQRLGRAAAGRRPRDRRAGAALLRHHGLYLEDRVRCRVREVFARRAADRQDDRAAVRGRRHRGDRIVLAGRRLHEPDLGRTAHDRRPARRCRREDRSASPRSWRASAATRNCAACATACAICRGRPRPGASAPRFRARNPTSAACRPAH